MLVFVLLAVAVGRALAVCSPSDGIKRGTFDPSDADQMAARIMRGAEQYFEIDKPARLLGLSQQAGVIDFCKLPRKRHAARATTPALFPAVLEPGVKR